MVNYDDNMIATRIGRQMQLARIWMISAKDSLHSVEGSQGLRILHLTACVTAV